MYGQSLFVPSIGLVHTAPTMNFANGIRRGGVGLQRELKKKLLLQDVHGGVVGLGALFIYLSISIQR